MNIKKLIFAIKNTLQLPTRMNNVVAKEEEEEATKEGEEEDSGAKE